jgi:DNA-binding Xre family transcriptional regulator
MVIGVTLVKGVHTALPSSGNRTEFGEANVRLRINELLRERGLTAYALAKRSEGRLGLRMAYRLTKQRGRFSTIRADVLEALCDALGVEPGELLERAPRKGRRR